MVVAPVSLPPVLSVRLCVCVHVRVHVSVGGWVGKCIMDTNLNTLDGVSKHVVLKICQSVPGAKLQ